MSDHVGRLRSQSFHQTSAKKLPGDCRTKSWWPHVDDSRWCPVVGQSWTTSAGRGARRRPTRTTGDEAWGGGHLMLRGGRRTPAVCAPDPQHHSGSVYLVWDQLSMRWTEDPHLASWWSTTDGATKGQGSSGDSSRLWFGHPVWCTASVCLSPRQLSSYSEVRGQSHELCTVLPSDCTDLP